MQAASTMSNTTLQAMCMEPSCMCALLAPKATTHQALCPVLRRRCLLRAVLGPVAAAAALVAARLGVCPALQDITAVAHLAQPRDAWGTGGAEQGAHRYDAMR
jgi:hypothetical protein